MRERFVKIIEVVAFILSVVLAIAWNYDREGDYEPIFTAAGVLFVAAEFYRRYGFPKSIESHTILDINYKNIFIARFIDCKNSDSGKFCLALYVFKIVNDSDKPFTIKSVILRYKLNDASFESDSHVLLTGSAYSHAEKNYKNSLIVRRTEGPDAVLMGWENLKVEIGRNQILPVGGVVSGSAAFILEMVDFEDYSKLKDTQIVIKDFNNRESVHNVDLSESMVHAGKDFVISPEKFRFDEKGEYFPA